MAWGAKAIPEGGYWAMPRLHAPGMVICGDAGGMVNVPRLKGIHYAIRSGMLAAETIYARLKAGSNDFSAYAEAVYASEIGNDLHETRNMKQPFPRASSSAVRSPTRWWSRRGGSRAATGRRIATASSR